MSALKIALDDIEKNMRGLAPHRKSELFKDFLVQGYTAMTLDTVPATRFYDLLRAKLCLGTMITLYDDFADRPGHANPLLLDHLYQFGFGRMTLTRSLNAKDQQTVDFARSLFAQMDEVLRSTPHYGRLSDLLNFDLAQFYSANQYSSLLTADPCLGNRTENRLYTHHNMGMVMMAMFDVMAIEDVRFHELGRAREVFVMGQRMGRIFNVLSTYEREKAEGDFTGELSTIKNASKLAEARGELAREILFLRERILSFDSQIESFSVKAYADGLSKVQELHKAMEGTI